VRTTGTSADLDVDALGRHKVLVDVGAARAHAALIRVLRRAILDLAEEALRAAARRRLVVDVYVVVLRRDGLLDEGLVEDLPVHLDRVAVLDELVVCEWEHTLGHAPPPSSRFMTAYRAMSKPFSLSFS